MDVTFFYTKKQLDVFLTSRFASTILCPRQAERKSLPTERVANARNTLSPRLESILEQFIETKKIVDPVIDEYIGSIEDQQLQSILHHTNSFSGWREKSFLIRISVLAMGHSFAEPLVKAASAIELLGIGACLLDDLIDETTTYESKKTTWVEYGLKEAICAYDVLRSLGARALLESCEESRVSTKNFTRIMSIFQKMQHDMSISQLTDIRSERNENFSEDNYYEMITRFPGSLYAGALEIGGVLSQVDPSHLNALREFGLFFAMANQIRDDLIEIIGEEEVIGKKIGADISRKKKRLPFIVFLKHNKNFTPSFQMSHCRGNTLNTILTRMKEDGTTDTCIDSVRRLRDMTISRINRLPANRWTNLLESITLLVGHFEEEVHERGQEK